MPTRIDAQPLEDVSAITFLGERLVEEQPVLKTWMLGSPATMPFETMEQTARGEYRLAGGLRRESIYPGGPGLQGHGGRRRARSILGPAAC